MKVIILFALLSLGLTIRCDSYASVPKLVAEYPRSIGKLNPGLYQSLRDTLNTFDGIFDCPAMDEFGHMISAGCEIDPSGTLPPIDQYLLSDITAAMVQYGKYTKVTDPVFLRVAYTYLVSDSASNKLEHISFIFEPQRVAGLIVELSTITVDVYANRQFLLSGHWYAQAVVPLNNVIGAEEAKEMAAAEISVSEDNLSLAGKLIRPVNDGESITLYVAWKFRTNSDINIYVDSSTGEVVDIAAF